MLKIAPHASHVFAVAVSRDERLLALGGKGGAPIAVREIDGGAPVALLPAAEVTLDVIALAFSADGQRLAAANAEGATWVWEIASGRLVASAPPQKKRKERRLVFVDGKKGDLPAMTSGVSKTGSFDLPSPDGLRVATLGAEVGIAATRSAAARKAVAETRLGLPRYPIAARGVRHASWTGDSRALALVGDFFAGAWFIEEDQFFATSNPVSGPRYGVALIRRLAVVIVPDGRFAPSLLALPAQPEARLFSPWETLVRRVDSTPAPADLKPQTSWEWNYTNSGYEGVNLEEGGLVWFEHTHNPHGGGAACEQTYEEYLATGPRVQSPPDVIGEEVLRAVRARLAGEGK